jgi:hypothetical protein
MNIVLVSIGNFQEYILVNVRQLIRLGHRSIYVITNYEFFSRFSEYADKITLVDAATLTDKFEYHQKTRMNVNFRQAFWVFTSSRFFYLYAFMEKYHVTDVIHLENDVPVYYNCDILTPLLDNTRVYIPMDAYDRAIASIVYIPRADVLERVLSHYKYNKNDMENFSLIARENPDLFAFFPICPQEEEHCEEQRYVTQLFPQFNIVFDAAAIGQYLGGVDPQNIPGDSTGFINETCVIKYNSYEFVWSEEEDDEVRRPFMVYNHKRIPIFNLHIHCKNLEKFV